MHRSSIGRWSALPRETAAECGAFGSTSSAFHGDQDAATPADIGESNLMSAQQSMAEANGGNIKLGDLTVRRLGFGAMRLCGPDVWGEPRDVGQARRVLKRVLE